MPKSKTLGVLSPKQLKTLVAIESYTTRRGYGPTLSEVAARLGLHAKNSARHYVLQLAALGLVTYEQVGNLPHAAARTLRLTENGYRLLIRIERLRTVPFLRGKLGLALDAHELRAAQRVGLPLKHYDVHLEGERTIITFKKNRDRDYWAGEIVEELER